MSIPLLAQNNRKIERAYWKLADTMSPKKVLAMTATTLQWKISDLKITPAYYTTQTGFFCNQERSLEKQTKIPLRFRLGSLSYTEKLEGYKN